MLTRKQHELLIFINDRITQTGISPSFDEMKEALDLRSKSGIHRLITALEERGFIRRLAHRARALEVLRMPDEASFDSSTQSRKNVTPISAGERKGFSPSVIKGSFGQKNDDGLDTGPSGQMASNSGDPEDSLSLPILGRIAAGTPIEAIQHEVDRFPAPAAMLKGGEHYILHVQGESMIEAGINDGDMAVIQRCNDASSGEIVVALVDDQEATLKRLRKKGASIALEAANPDFETRIYGPDRVNVQGRLVGLMRVY